MINVPEIFGSMVFNDAVMQERLTKETYKSLHKTIEDGKELDIAVANAVALAMKDWAVEKGATHFTHWFQPMTGRTAEKHDSFVSPQPDGRAIMEFSGKELIKGEPDASSFPSGGLRATFEARGYTAWDPTSYAFVKDGVLCIPTAFCSYGGEALDKKTPLLRSMEEINTQAMRILRLFGNNEVKHVLTTVGAEQEYFLVDRELYNRREDLIFCGRTLFGAPAPKGQEMDDHYFGAIKPRISAFMKELNEELWKLGVYARTEHNEAAPAQHELAPIYTTTNQATDQNQVMMEIMRNVARKHGLVCLLHEKPFAGVNGSGKHNNWSISTDTGVNLLEPGKSPHENAQFLLFLAAMIKGIDEYQEMMRVCVASAGNDHRLGAAEAPPAIVSVFIGDDLAEVLDCIENGKSYAGSDSGKMEIGVSVLPAIPKDSTDRNRTSPFAFTGNKFEYRSVGSSQSIAGANTVINTIMAEELKQFADELEKAGEENFTKALNELIKKTIREHKRILFNGDGYSEVWEEEAKRRGLANLKTTVDALPTFLLEKNIKLFTSHNIYTEKEMRSRYAILLDSYNKIINIEAHTMIDMARKEILPAVSAYVGGLFADLETKLSVAEKLKAPIPHNMEEETAVNLSTLCDEALTDVVLLETLIAKSDFKDDLARGQYYRDSVIPAMNELRKTCDAMEKLTAKEMWPLPQYGDMLFNI
ncbi:MAG: glutamine synthetase type III [Lachnospiraceae bacterium]|nr:glutamine synthetase type III [Lachnospiraceae bacterium]